MRMMKRCLLMLAAVIVLLMGCAPAMATEYLSAEEREESYSVCIEALQFYLNGDDTIDLESLYGVLTEDIPSYKMSTQLAYYIRVLIYIEEGNFDPVPMVVDLLGVYNDFETWLAETEGLGTLEQLGHYAEGRRAEAEGRSDEAEEAYILCGDFYDAVIRRMNLAMVDQEELAMKYEEALRLYQSGRLREALALMREVAQYNYGQSVRYVSMLEDLMATPTPPPTPTPTPTATPVPELRLVIPDNIGTQYQYGTKGYKCDPDELWNMVDDDIQTSYYWLVYKSDYIDSRPEFTFDFSNVGINEIQLRNGRLVNSNAYKSFKRMNELEVLIYCQGMPVAREKIKLEDRYTTDYLVFSLSRTYTNVQRVEFYYRGGYNGQGSNIHICHITDIKFIGYD